MLFGGRHSWRRSMPLHARCLAWNVSSKNLDSLMPAGIGDPRRVEKLRRDHAVEAFDCGDEQLNKYLLRYAWQNQQAGASQTYVGVVGDAIIGFHTLAMGQVMYDDAPRRLTKG